MECNKNNKGFTMIELLATIAVLAVIISIVVLISLNVVEKSKIKSYEVTIKNIEDDANNFVLENSDLNPWMPTGSDNNQYQCVTVQNLIDVGYFKGDVLDSKVADDTYVQANDYIYLERNENNAITKSILLIGNEFDKSYLDACKSTPEVESYTVVYDANGGNNAPDSQTKIKDNDLILSSDIPTREGYRFVGWNTKADGTLDYYNPGDVYDKNVSVTLYAQWSDKKLYSVTYVAVSGLGPGATASATKKYCVNAKGEVSGSMVHTTCIEGEDCTLSKNVFSREDLVFSGWTTTEYTFNSTKKPTIKYTDGYTIKGGITSNITLYTVWESSHKWDIVGTRLINGFGKLKFNCGHEHTMAYTIYCSKCHMSSSHYRDCYRPAYETVDSLHCPHALTRNIISLVNDNVLGGGSVNLAKYWGGTIEGKDMFELVNKSEFVSADRH